ncbi:DUF3861 domain-containing protein [Chitinolyticbacter meiyuanensis]|uniref:DUF3861 domain-containing protein n=1 Tax=Chitinolyticbacter meiyuanensis TaxID=682798 RepID=UPI0011E59586|nr:DUF3861 domain-containing protein [Chitinolyticbacter meiyuanensis]
MKQHRYRITVEHVAGKDPGDALAPPLRFHATNHDDLSAIVTRLRSRERWSDDDAAAIAIGLKLLSEQVLLHRDDALLASLKGPLGAFIAELKQLPDPD